MVEKTFNCIFEVDECEAQVDTEHVSSENDVHLYKITVSYPEKRVPEKIRIRWLTPFEDIFAVWTSGSGVHKPVLPSWAPMVARSRSAAGSPVFCLLSKNGENRCTFSLSDMCSPVRLSGGMNENRRGYLECSVSLFTNLVAPIDKYEVFLRIDYTKQPYYESVYDVREWWYKLGYTPMKLPEAAKHTMFSTWYSLSKSINEENVLEQCRMAKEYGMDTVIVDDGWQCDEVAFGYAYCGDWEPAASKFPDMRRFVDRLHEIGMKCILWYSVPYVGIHAKNYERFFGKYLRNDRNARWLALDPRFPEVREFLVNLYVDALKAWDLDGFKLDFIDSFGLTDQSSTDYEAMDCTSVEVAVDILLNEISTALKQIKPDILIEFRQAYTGPVMQKYGNLLRVGDCGGAAMVNRAHSLDLRLVTGDITRHPTTAIHSDMLAWDYDAAPEAAADQISACLFCVPQISVLFDKITDEQKKMLACYTDFLEKYRHVRLEGKLKPLYPDANYSLAIAEKDGVALIGMYNNVVIELPQNMKEIVIVNASGYAPVYIENKSSAVTKAYVVKNCMGEIVEEGSVNFEGIIKIEVPHNGFLYLQ